MKILDALNHAFRRTNPRAPSRMSAARHDHVAQTIERALQLAGLQPPAPGAGPGDQTIEPAGAVNANGQVLPTLHARLLPRRADAVTAPGPRALAGRFLARSFANHAGERAYRLYVPSTYDAGDTELLPLIVMLHGCTQTPEDFAAGTRMNALAEEHGFLVAYPEQSAAANGSRCWNWFSAADQVRDSGEPAVIAGITRTIAADYRVDSRRIFVAGLSAGAAMALILGRTYPDIYAGVGIHSGLPYRSAHDVPSAFAAMRRPASDAAARPRDATQAERRMPMIVFHGDQDRTVAARNADTIVEQECLAAGGVLLAREAGVSASGRGYQRTVYGTRGDEPHFEFWLLRGAGHAWSGGGAEGSYTDPTGPDASAEMIRFFTAQVLAPATPDACG